MLINKIRACQKACQLVNKANLVHNLFLSTSIYQFLHVLGDYVPIIRRDNCVYVTHVMTVWYAGWKDFHSTLHTRQLFLLMMGT